VAAKEMLSRLTGLAALLALFGATVTTAQQCPANSNGVGGGADCVCAVGYEGTITYRQFRTPPDYQGTCMAKVPTTILGVGTGFFVGIILFVLSAIFFVVASKTSFECSTCAHAVGCTLSQRGHVTGLMNRSVVLPVRRLTNFGLLIFWGLLVLIVLYAPRESAAKAADANEVT
jgi:hypothetical protein